MKEASIEHVAEPSELTDVKSEQIHILFAAIPSSLFTVLVASSILSIAQWHVIDQQIILCRFIITNLLSMLRLYMFR